jgi:putative ABC transport system substrate-binding protein
MKRRDFIKATAIAAALRPLAARAQQRDKPRVIGALVTGIESDSETVARLTAFRTALQELGWTSGTNLHFDFRFSEDDDTLRQQAKELSARGPDVLLAVAPPATLAMIRATRTIPIVFAAVTDPVSLGVVQSLAHPGGNVTGFLSAEFSFSTKWLELLREIAPNVRRVGVLTAMANRGSIPQFAAIQAVAATAAIDATMLGFQNPADIERGISDFARSPNGGLIVLRISEAITQRDLIVRLAAEHKLPAVYSLNVFVEAGGLIAYGPVIVEQFRQAATYIDRILKGTKPADLPVQAPTKYEMTINLKTAKALGLTLPPAVLSRADQVIE